MPDVRQMTVAWVDEERVHVLYRARRGRDSGWERIGDVRWSKAGCCWSIRLHEQYISGGDYNLNKTKLRAEEALMQVSVCSACGTMNYGDPLYCQQPVKYGCMCTAAWSD